MSRPERTARVQHDIFPEQSNYIRKAKSCYADQACNSVFRVRFIKGSELLFKHAAFFIFNLVARRMFRHVVCHCEFVKYRVKGHVYKCCLQYIDDMMSTWLQTYMFPHMIDLASLLFQGTYYFRATILIIQQQPLQTQNFNTSLSC